MIKERQSLIVQEYKDQGSDYHDKLSQAIERTYNEKKYTDNYLKTHKTK